MTQTFVSVQNAIGSIDLTNLNFLNIFTDLSSLIATGVQSLVCTDCIKEAYTIARQDFPDIVSQVNSEVEELCGASFIGKLPC